MEKSFLRSVMTNNYNGEMSEVTSLHVLIKLRNFRSREKKTNQFFLTINYIRIDENRKVLFVCFPGSHY